MGTFVALNYTMWELKSYKLYYEFEKNVTTKMEFDFSYTLIGVIHYLNKKVKRNIFINNKIVDEEY